MSPVGVYRKLALYGVSRMEGAYAGNKIIEICTGERESGREGEEKEGAK